MLLPRLHTPGYKMVLYLPVWSFQCKFSNEILSCTVFILFPVAILGSLIKLYILFPGAGKTLYVFWCQHLKLHWVVQFWCRKSCIDEAEAHMFLFLHIVWVWTFELLEGIPAYESIWPYCECWRSWGTQRLRSSFLRWWLRSQSTIKGLQCYVKMGRNKTALLNSSPP